jgi:23S rRNA pseudouridine2605 synthase
MPEVRLQKVIAQAGVASRRKAENFITQGRVQVNGRVVTTLGTTVDPGTDVVVVDGHRVRPRAPLQYILLNKPKGYVTTCEDDQGRPTVFDLLKRQAVRLFPVGRLDFNSEGVLLLTNDGELANCLLHPRYHVPRVYIVKVQGVLTDRDLDHLRQGVVLDDGKTLPIRAEGVRRTDTGCTVRLTLYEGRYRQIHRMLERCGPYRVKGLQRVAMGPLTVAGLPRGQARHLEAFEVERLKQASTSRVRSTGSQTKTNKMKPEKTTKNSPYR